MTKAQKHSIYCTGCDWELKDTHKHTDGLKCPNCKDGIIAPGKREGRRNEKPNSQLKSKTNNII